MVAPGNLTGRQARYEMTGAKVKRLRRKMDQNGFDMDQPIEVVEVGDDLIIWDGHQRTKAARQSSNVREVPIKRVEVSDQVKSRLAEEAAQAAGSN